MQELQTIKHNHRKIAISEVCWDIDTGHQRVISDKIHDFVSSNLIKDNISHQVWDTSRSPHIHSFFKDMNLYSQEVRRDIRFLILKNYSGKYFNWIDKSKASENNMIRDFGGIHEVTGKPKTLIYEFRGKPKFALNANNYVDNKGETPINPIPALILEQLGVLYQQRNKVPEIVCNELTDGNKRAMHEFITYCCENVHTHDGRERILFKNIVIACLLLGYNTNERTRIYYNIVRNCRGRHVNELVQWDKFMQKQKRLWINWKEINLFYKKIEIV